MWILVLQRLTLEFFLDFLYFPIWWYTGGVLRAGRFCFGLLQAGNLRLSPGLWLKNILVPMFGQTDWQGRLVSFFMRLVNFIARGLALFFWLLFVIFVFLLWIVAPVFVVWMMINSI